uniref:Putative secreted protein n=1 Tax=Ixodes ricinus TaxID=34613 RepID=A0A147BBR6_IXORI
MKCHHFGGITGFFVFCLVLGFCHSISSWSDPGADGEVDRAGAPLSCAPQAGSPAGPGESELREPNVRPRPEPDGRVADVLGRDLTPSFCSASFCVTEAA